VSNPVCYLGLVHHPVKNKRDEVVTTSVTNLDIHDIARSCRTYGVKQYHIITPLTAQHQLINRILNHWKTDKSAAYNPDRQNALALTTLSPSIEESIRNIQLLEGVAPMVVVTGANFEQHDGEVSELKKRMQLDKRPIFLLFGTGWGLTSTICEQADFRLAPLNGPGDYNHLSVRSAVAIYCDRLLAREIKN
jgi:hypothetical protein